MGQRRYLEELAVAAAMREDTPVNFVKLAVGLDNSRAVAKNQPLQFRFA
jgi:hypothetical protein